MLKDSTDFIIFLIFRIYLGDSGIHGRENVVNHIHVWHKSKTTMAIKIMELFFRHVNAEMLHIISLIQCNALYLEFLHFITCIGCFNYF